MLLRSIDRSRQVLTLKVALRILKLSTERYHSWKREESCDLDDVASCPRISPRQLTRSEIRAVKEMVTSQDYRLRADRNAFGTRPAARKGIRVLVNVVQARSALPLEATAMARPPGETEARNSGRAAERGLAHRHDGNSASRFDAGLSPRGDRQLFTKNPGVEGLRYHFIREHGVDPS